MIRLTGAAVALRFGRFVTAVKENTALIRTETEMINERRLRTNF